MVSQKNRGNPLDYHYAEYSLHYNLCAQLSSRLCGLTSGVNSPGYNQLRQQFNSQFRQNALEDPPARLSQWSRELERKSSLLSQLASASAPLTLERASEDMVSVEGASSASSESFETVSASESEDSFSSVHGSSESEEELPEEQEEEASDVLSSVCGEWRVVVESDAPL